MIYLASPYSHPDPSVREARFQAACSQAAEMLRCGIPVFSPIAHTHPIAAYGLPLEWASWEKYDRVFLEMCSEVWILMLDGWRESKGVQAEMELARELGKPVVLVEPGDALNDQTPVAASLSAPRASRQAGRAGVVEAEVEDDPTP
ncbi:MAG: DUF1937 family protein [Planctomycetes bacterium]|nr:DUF1937 family protein [Planctomycetota bacterium]